jgi:hypothetical protein
LSASWQASETPWAMIVVVAAAYLSRDQLTNLVGA